MAVAAADIYVCVAVAGDKILSFVACFISKLKLNNLVQHFIYLHGLIPGVSSSLITHA